MMGYGYENEQGDRISALIDMINGGGAGRSGDTFEGGGILSLLANAVAQPYGSVRERPGHSPMGMERPMDVSPMVPRTPEEVATDTLRALETRVAGPGDAVSPAMETTVLDSLDGAGAPAGEEFRRFTAEDLAALASAHPDVASFFFDLQVGDALSPREAMILDALRLGSLTARRPGPESGAMPGARRSLTARRPGPESGAMPRARPRDGLLP
jgi:hypothetical protein